MTDASLLSASVHYQIPFHDIDSMHIAWHGHYFKYFGTRQAYVSMTSGETALSLPPPVEDRLNEALRQTR